MKTSSRLLPLVLLLVGLPASQAQQPTPLLTQSAEENIRVLRSNAPLKEKSDACRQLSVLGGADAVEALAALLPDEQLNHMARYALEAIPSSAAGAALRGALQSLEGRPLVGTIHSVGVRRDTEAVPALTRLLLDDNPDAAQAAAHALGEIGSPSAANVLRRALGPSTDRRRLAISEGLLRCAKNLATEGQRQEAAGIFDELRKLKAPAHVRVAGLRGAILVRGNEGIARLRQELEGSDDVLFAAAIRTSYEMPAPQVTRVLAAELGRVEDPDRKILIIQALGRRPDGANLAPLTRAAKEGAKPVRVAALLALAETGNGAAAPVLADLAVDPDKEIAQAALDGLAGLEGSQADTTVAAMLQDANVPRRLAAIELAGRRRMTGAVPDLLRASGEDTQQVRPAALSKVGELGTASDVPAVLALLPKLRTSEDLDAAEQALASLCGKAERPQECAAQLVSSLSEGPAPRRSMLLQVLAAVGGPNALQAVRTALRDSDPQLHAGALRALGAWKTADAAPELLALAKNADSATDKTLALRGYLGMAANADLPVAQRLDMCRAAGDVVRSEEDRQLLLSALGATGSVDALELIEPHLDRASTRDEAGAAVVAVAGKLLKSEVSAPEAVRLAQSLGKVAEQSTNPDVVRRAKNLLEQAKKKAG